MHFDKFPLSKKCAVLFYPLFNIERLSVVFCNFKMKFETSYEIKYEIIIKTEKEQLLPKLKTFFDYSNSNILYRVSIFKLIF